MHTATIYLWVQDLLKCLLAVRCCEGRLLPAGADHGVMYRLATGRKSTLAVDATELGLGQVGLSTC